MSSAQKLAPTRAIGEAIDASIIETPRITLARTSRNGSAEKEIERTSSQEREGCFHYTNLVPDGKCNPYQ